MVVYPQFVTKTGAYSWEWKKDEQFFIHTKTKPSPTQTLDLVFMSGVLAFEWGSSDEDWINDTLVTQFRGIKWASDTVQVAPVVSLGSISNIQTDDTESIGWGIVSTQVGMVPHPKDQQVRIIELTTGIAVRGVDSHLSRATYFVAAMGLMRGD